MTFYTYMMKNYLKAGTPAGDLARDMREDKEKFPRNSSVKYAAWHRFILEYLMENDACEDCLNIFEKCWKEYELRERKRRGIQTCIGD